MNRFEIVSRHNPKITKIDAYSPLTVGNGEFAFTADVTGLQTFPESYAEGIPLCTQSQRGWHTIPADTPGGGYNLSELRYDEIEVRGKKVPYPLLPEGQEEIYNWLRQNPHRLHLGRVGLALRKENGEPAGPEDITGVSQELILWEGVLQSEFEAMGEKVVTEVLCHPQKDVLGVKVKSALFKKNSLAVEIAFPYGSPLKQAADWESPEKHETEIAEFGGTELLLKRMLDDDKYYVDIRFEDGAQAKRKSAHCFAIMPESSDELTLMIGFSEKYDGDIPQYSDAKIECANYWTAYWKKGGMVDFSACKDKRAYELERRTVLSQYLLAVQCAGSLPPQETGLTFNSWYGKFHLEMHWWHAVHFAYWGKPELFEKSLWWYGDIMDKAKATAKMQGFKGARWPKMTDFTGNESPSFIGPLLIWQQPHPIYYAELIYSVKKDAATLEKYKDIVFETAEFMASYAYRVEKTGRYVLGPGLIPAQENHKPQDTINPAFELEYWHFGLKTANKWRERLGMEKNEEWEDICENLAELPQKDGAYLAHENCPDTYEKFNFDHPSMLGAMGILPGEKTDKETMKNTMKKVFEKWNFGHVWGWDFPMMAMTFARLGMPEKAIESLLYDAPKNEYLINGHNKQGDKGDLPIYLPGNGGFLTAIAMMAAGWKGCGKKNPGFPEDGNWDINWEGLYKML